MMKLVVNRRDRRQYNADDGGYVIARRDPGVRTPLADGEWLVTAFSADVTTAQGIVWFNEAGFRGRQWESTIDGQQYPTLKAAMTASFDLAQRQSDMARRIRERASLASYHNAARDEASDPGK
jgi:hypothetical protein